VSHPSLDAFRRSVLPWLVAATALWLIAAAIDRRTVVVIESLGDHVRFAVAGTELVLPGTFASLDRITIEAADSIDHPGAVALALEHDGRIEPLPVARRFPVVSAEPPPVADWWVDHRDRPATVFVEDTNVGGPFTLRAVLRGRFTDELTFVLHGRPNLRLSLRRGLLDNYLAIRSGDGELIDVTTLDPTPSADLGALAAQLLRALSAACLVIALVGILTAVGGGRPQRRSADRPSTTGDRPARRLKTASLAAAIVLALLSTALSVWTAVRVFDGLPHQIDEVVDLLQARWLLDGDVAPSATAIQDHLRVPFTYLVDGRWLGHYPIGWPVLLAGGLAVGAPHLVAPVLGGIFVILLFFVGRELDDDVTGLAAAALAVVSPLARLLSGSMFPHVACAVLVLVALWLLLLSRRLPMWWLGAGAGVAMGACLAVRPMTAVAVSLVLGVWLIAEGLTGDRPRPTWITVTAATSGGLLASLPTLAHNAVVTGHALTLPYSLAGGTMYGLDNIPFGLRNLDAILVSASASLTGWGWPFTTDAPVLALSLAFVAVPFLLRRTRSEDRLLVAVLVVVALGHLPTKANGLHGYGARYVLDVAGCYYLLSARGFRELARWARPSRTAVAAVVAVFLALNLTALAVLPTRLGLYRGYYGVTGELERQLAAAGVDQAIILLEGDDWEPWGESARLMTGPRRHEIVIAADLGDTSVIEAAYPGRPVFRWDGQRLVRDDRGAD